MIHSISAAARVRHAPVLSAILSVAILSVSGASVWAAGPITLTFDSHGAFFSNETHQPVAIDPQVFVQVPGASAGVGPQNITHATGLAPVRLSDPSDTPLYNAESKPLEITLGQWLGARGEATIAPAGGRSDEVRAAFAHLIPGGVYSLFEVTFAPGGNTFAPLDGTGATNSFAARTTGTAQITVFTRTLLTHANAVLLVYHSDGYAHGRQRGAPGVTAHHQLIARIL